MKILIQSKYNFLLQGMAFDLFLFSGLSFFVFDCYVFIFIAYAAIIMLLLCIGCPNCGEEMFKSTIEDFNLNYFRFYKFSLKKALFLDVECPCCGYESKGLWNNNDILSHSGKCLKKHITKPAEKRKKRH